jgi:hypothetical protein
VELRSRTGLTIGEVWRTFFGKGRHTFFPVSLRIECKANNNQNETNM